MLVPSPSDESLSRPLIGDKRVDQFDNSDETSSELSNFDYDNFHKDEISTTSVNKNLTVELPTTEQKQQQQQQDAILAVTKLLRQQSKNEILINSNKSNNQIDKIDDNNNNNGDDNTNKTNNNHNDDDDNKITSIAITASTESLNEATLFESPLTESSDKIEQEFEEILMNESYIVPGSIAEREKIKWLNAPPIANNPYSSEALEKRLSKLKMKHSLFDVSTDNLNHTPPLNNDEDADNDEQKETFQLREDITKFVKITQKFIVDN